MTGFWIAVLVFAGVAAAAFALLGAASRTVVACATAPHAAVATMSPGGERHELAAVIREEIVRALNKR